MTDYKKKNLIEAYDNMQAAARGVDGMTSDQYEAIKQAAKAIEDALDYILECHDVRLSDIDKLQRAQYALMRSINTEPSEYQIEGWQEYGIGDYATDNDTADASIHERTEPHITF